MFRSLSISSLTREPAIMLVYFYTSVQLPRTGLYRYVLATICCWCGLFHTICSLIAAALCFGSKLLSLQSLH